MRMKLFLSIFCLLSFVPVVKANPCAKTIIVKVQAYGGSITSFNEKVCKTHLVQLARHPVRRFWKNMSQAEQSSQVEYACQVFHSVANKLKKLDPKKIEWRGNIGRYPVTIQGKTEIKTIKVSFSGGCVATTACISGYCLENMIKDKRKIE